MSTETIHCHRCKSEGPALPAPPWPGEQGEEIAAKVCRPCFQEWQPMQIKVLNELRLDLGDPEQAALLDAHMMIFFGLMDPAIVGLPASPYGYGEGGPEGSGETRLD
ncbi:MAG: Fe(2+)-trafficking protein [Deltaproteobacteria bacterium]|nr:Fe(2+)-trafficking protein [Deltaproteobacteria bacterium]